MKRYVIVPDPTRAAGCTLLASRNREGQLSWWNPWGYEDATAKRNGGAGRGLYLMRRETEAGVYHRALRLSCAKEATLMTSLVVPIQVGDTHYGLGGPRTCRWNFLVSLVIRKMSSTNRRGFHP